MNASPPHGAEAFFSPFMNAFTPDPAPWEKLGESTLANTRVFEVRNKRYRHPHRSVERHFSVIAAPDWVNVLAVTPERHLVLVNQFRFGVETFSLEIPGGMIDAGEDPLAGGLRELREETGFAGTQVRLLGSVHPNPAIMNNRCHFVLVEAAVQSAPTAWDPDEEISISTAPVEEVFKWARSGRITHALVLNALWFFEPVWNKGAGRGI